MDKPPVSVMRRACERWVKSEPETFLSLLPECLFVMAPDFAIRGPERVDAESDRQTDCGKEPSGKVNEFC